MLLVDRYVALQLAQADFGANCPNHNLRACLDQQFWGNTVGSGFVVHVFELNRRQEALPVFVAGANAIQSLTGTVGVDGSPSAQQKTPPAGSADNFVGRQL